MPSNGKIINLRFTEPDYAEAANKAKAKGQGPTPGNLDKAAHKGGQMNREKRCICGCIWPARKRVCDRCWRDMGTIDNPKNGARVQAAK